MKLIVGLGNPGTKYEGTRHNVGFEVLERLARENQADPLRPKFDGDAREVRLGSEKALLLWPQTFMNKSGTSVRKAVDFYQLSLSDVLVICDEFQLPLGVLRIRPQGSDGGHNGLADVIRTLGSQEFARLRIGVGPVPDRWSQVDFVLGKFTKDERGEVDLQVARSADAAVAWATAGVTAAMNQFNGKKE